MAYQTKMAKISQYIKNLKKDVCVVCDRVFCTILVNFYFGRWLKIGTINNSFVVCVQNN